MSRAPVFLVAAAITTAIGAPAPARACSFAGPPVHVVDPAMQATDQTAPMLKPLDAPTVARGFAPGACSGSASSCDDIGIIQVFPNATDDMTAADRIGYRLTLAAGVLPSGLTLPADAIDLEPGYPYLRLTWVDGASDNQDAFEFTLAIVAIDLAGNESTPQAIVVGDGGAPRGGCRLSPGRSPGPPEILLALLGLALAARRRRRART
jgi:MYXO-CTERM domain-containing protein